MLLAIARQLIPPRVWEAGKRVLRRRSAIRAAAQASRGDGYRSKTYQGVVTRHNARPLHVGRFAELYERRQPLDPHVPLDTTRYRIYNVCTFARLCRHVPGDFLVAGVSFGVAPRVVYDYVDFSSLGKTFHFVDPFLGIRTVAEPRKLAKYNDNFEYVRKQYPSDAPVRFHLTLIPVGLPLPGVNRLAFVHLNTSDHRSEAESLPYFIEAMSPGGVLIIDDYAIDDGHFEVYDPVLRDLGIEPLWLPSGQCVLSKTV